MRILLMLLCFVIAVFLGIISVLIVGNITFVSLVNLAVKTGHYAIDPFAGPENYGASFAIVLGSILYFLTGLLAGAIAGWQIYRLRQSFMPVFHFPALAWLGLNAGLTYLAAGLLSGTAAAIFLYSGSTVAGSASITYQIRVFSIVLVAIACLSFNFVLPSLLAE